MAAGRQVRMHAHMRAAVCCLRGIVCAYSRGAVCCTPSMICRCAQLARRPVRVRTCEQRVLSPWRHVCMRRSSCATTRRAWLTLRQVRMHAGTACCLRTHRVSSTTMKPSLAHTPSAACSLPGAHAHMRAAACFPRGALCVLHKSSCVCCSSSTTRRPSTARTSSGAHECTHIHSCLMSLWHHAYAYTSRSSCAPSLLRGDAARHSLLVARCARAGAEYLRAAPSPPRCREARFACHQVRRRACEQLRACGHTPEQLPERNLCTYTGSAVRCLVSTAMMPSLARTTSAVCSLPGAHAHTRSVVCLCWWRGVMLTCTRAGVCWASSTRGMRAARTSQRRSQAGLARRRVRGGVHTRRSRSALRLLQCGRARLARRQERTRFAHTRLCASTTAPYARTQEQPCAASPPRQCCQHDSQATRRAAARCPHGDMRAHAGAAVRGVSPTTKPIRPTAVRPSSGAHTHMRAIATVCRLHSTVSTSQGQPRAASPQADDVAPPGDVLAKPNWLINQSSSS